MYQRLERSVEQDDVASYRSIADRLRDREAELEIELSTVRGALATLQANPETAQTLEAIIKALRY